MSETEIKGYMPGAIGRIAELHATYYHKNWDFGQFFEAKVATELSAFLDRFDKLRDGFWTVCLDNRVEGSITIDARNAEKKGAHLRWFIMSSNLRGKGYGNLLMEKSVNLCKLNGYPSIYLWTFKGLSAACHLYEKFGFKLNEEVIGSQWGTEVKEQKYVLELR